MESAERRDAARQGPAVPTKARKTSMTTSVRLQEARDGKATLQNAEDSRRNSTTGPTPSGNHDDRAHGMKKSIAEHFPSHIRKEGGGMEEAGAAHEDGQADRVRLLVGR